MSMYEEAKYGSDPAYQAWSREMNRAALESRKRRNKFREKQLQTNLRVYNTELIEKAEEELQKSNISNTKKSEIQQLLHQLKEKQERHTRNYGKNIAAVNALNKSFFINSRNKKWRNNARQSVKNKLAKAGINKVPKPFLGIGMLEPKENTAYRYRKHIEKFIPNNTRKQTIKQLESDIDTLYRKLQTRLQQP